MKFLLIALVTLTGLLGATTVAEAGTLTINYSVTIDQVYDPDGISGVNVGDTVSGSLHFNFNGPVSVYDYPTVDGYEATGSATADVNGLHYSSHDVLYQNQHYKDGSGFQQWYFLIAPDAGQGISGQTWVYISGFIDMPTVPTFGANIQNLISLLQSNSVGAGAFFRHAGADGTYWASGPGSTAAFTISQTPIPAALPLFASALGGLTFVGWRRRSGQQAAA